MTPGEDIFPIVTAIVALDKEYAAQWWIERGTPMEEPMRAHWRTASSPATNYTAACGADVPLSYTTSLASSALDGTADMRVHRIPAMKRALEIHLCLDCAVRFYEYTREGRK